MSVIFVVGPAVHASWPVLAAAASALAARYGLKAVRETSEQVEEESRLGAQVEIPLEGSQIGVERMSTDTRIRLQDRDGIQVDLYVDERQRALLHVSGEDRSEEELRQKGQDFLGRLIQQYAYETIVNNLEEKGYSLVEEEADQDGRIRLRVRRWE